MAPMLLEAACAPGLSVTDPWTTGMEQPLARRDDGVWITDWGAADQVSDRGSLVSR